MRAFDFWIMMLCCLGWGTNFVVSTWALGGTSVPPFMLAATRALLVLLMMGVFLFRPLPDKFLRLIFVSLCVGALHLGFLYTGFQTAPASGSSIISQAVIPIATVVSFFWLKETVSVSQGIAIIGAMIGVVIMVYEPGALRLDVGLMYVLAAYFVLAVGSVAVRTIPEIDWRVYVAWTAVVVLIFSVIVSALFETDHKQVWSDDKMPLLIAAGYAAVGVSVFAHGQYFRLLQTYPVNKVVPLSLMITVFATILGVIFLKETLYPRYLLGAALILPCVWFISRGGAPAPVEMD
ncbi:MAG: DMT family transporter [Litorimonas sp.]